MRFAGGDRVAWHHTLGVVYGEGSILRESALNALAPGTPKGTVDGAANVEETYWVVRIDKEFLTHPQVVTAAGTHDDPNKLVLTSEELVRIAEGS